MVAGGWWQPGAAFALTAAIACSQPLAPKDDKGPPVLENHHAGEAGWKAGALHPGPDRGGRTRAGRHDRHRCGDRGRSAVPGLAGYTAWGRDAAPHGVPDPAVEPAVQQQLLRRRKWCRRLGDGDEQVGRLSRRRPGSGKPQRAGAHACRARLDGPASKPCPASPPPGGTRVSPRPRGPHSVRSSARPASPSRSSRPVPR